MARDCWDDGEEEEDGWTAQAEWMTRTPSVQLSACGCALVHADKP